jgi:hypothetical protein
MADRRALLEGLSDIEEIDRERAEDFVYNQKPRSATKSGPPPKLDDHVAEATVVPPMSTSAAASAAVTASTSFHLASAGRVPFGARVRTELASAVKRTSLERQLQGVQPNSVQDILEEALELWLHRHGLLK